MWEQTRNKAVCVKEINQFLFLGEIMHPETHKQKKLIIIIIPG